MRLVGALTDAEMSSGRGEYVADLTTSCRVRREMTITVTPLHNFFAPRLDEPPALVPSLPGAPSAMPADAR